MEGILNSDGVSPIVGFNATAGSPKERFAFLSSLRSIQNAPPLLDEEDLVGSLAPVVMACFMDNKEPNKPELLAKFGENTEDKDWLKGLILAQTTNFVEAGSDIGSHTAKIPNVSVQGPGGLFVDPVISKKAAEYDFVSSFSIASGRSVGAAGNASRTRAYRLLTSRFRIGNEIVDLASDIGTGGPLSVALIEMGFPEETIAKCRDAIKTGMAGQGSNGVDAAAKVLMWPIGGDEYVAITPVHSYAMHIEINKRIRTIRESEGWINTRDINVGGSKPQNAGLVNSDLGGRHPHLTGYPPEATSPEMSLLWRIKNGFDLLRSYAPSDNEAPATFVKTVQNEAWSNKTSRDVLYRCIVAMAFASLENVLTVRELLDNDEWELQVRDAINCLPTWVVAVIEGDLRDHSDEIRDQAVNNVAANIIRMIGTERNGEKKGVDVDTALRTLIEQTVAEFIVTV